MKLTSLIRNLSFFLSRFPYKQAIIVFLLFIASLANGLHESYPDEFDNLLGGKYILSGRFPYSGFFTHHAPIGYFVSAVPLLFSGISFYKFRIFYSILLALYFIYVYYFISRRFTRTYSRIILASISLITIASTYFWGQMLLADPLAAYFMLPAVALLFGRIIYGQSLSRNDFFYISLFTCLALFTSLTYIYLVFVIMASSLIYYARRHQYNLFSYNFVKSLLIVLTPYLVVLAYFIISRSYLDFYRQAITFNTQYYLYNYPRPEGSTQFNPLRYIISISYTFFMSYSALLQSAFAINWAAPFNTTLAVMSFFFIVYLVTKRQYYLAALYFILLITSSVRSNPVTSTEHDYQSSMYFVIALYGSVAFMCFSIENILSRKIDSHRIVSYLFVFIGSIYSLFFCIFILRSFFTKTYDKYMGTAPLIYDRPQRAPLVQAAISYDDYAWIGPFDFEDLFYLKARIPSRYHIMIPAMRNAGLTSEQLSDVSKVRPKVIYFDKYFYVLGKSPQTYGKEFITFLSQEYVTLLNYRVNGFKYVSTQPITLRYDPEDRLFIRKDSVQEVSEKLVKAGFLKKVSE